MLVMLVFKQLANSGLDYTIVGYSQIMQTTNAAVRAADRVAHCFPHFLNLDHRASCC